MKKINYLLVALVLPFLSCKEQPKVEMNTKPNADSVAKTAPVNDASEKQYTDANGRKQGYWIIMDADKKPPIPGYPPDAKIEEGKYIDDKREGIWVEYLPGGEIKRKVKYANDSIVEVIQEEKKEVKKR